MKAFHEVRSYESDFMVWYSSYVNISFLAHWHKEIELIYIRKGSAQISVNDEIFVAYAGDLVICDSGSIHYSDSYTMDNTLDFLVFDPNIVSSVYEIVDFVHPLIKKDTLLSLGIEDLLLKLLDDVKAELNNKSPFYQEIVSSNLKHFWYILKRKLPKNTDAMSKNSRRAVMLNDLQLLLSFIDEHYSGNITLEYAAKMMNFSPCHFSKVFKKLTGINFVTYLNMIRIEQSAALLKSSPDKITNIALSCGFNNVRTFNRVFKEITGFTPSQFLEAKDYEISSLTYLKRKTAEKQYVENDSVTLINNTVNTA